MKRLLKYVLAATMVVGSACGASASIINPGFETGDMTGWDFNSSSLTSVVTTATASNETVYTAADGDYFLRLRAGGGAGVYTTASQFFAGAGQTISGYAAFLAQDYLPFNDNAYVKIFDTNKILLTTAWSSDVGTVGDYGNTPWTEWSWTAPTAGTYLLEYGVTNIMDNGLPSEALFDAPEAVPEPSTLVLLGAGLGAIAIIRRRKSAC